MIWIKVKNLTENRIEGLPPLGTGWWTQEQLLEHGYTEEGELDTQKFQILQVVEGGKFNSGYSFAYQQPGNRLWLIRREADGYIQTIEYDSSGNIESISAWQPGEE